MTRIGRGQTRMYGIFLRERSSHGPLIIRIEVTCRAGYLLLILKGPVLLQEAHLLRVGALHPGQRHHETKYHKH